MILDHTDVRGLDQVVVEAGGEVGGARPRCILPTVSVAPLAGLRVLPASTDGAI
jgi:hypothetical protein